MSFPFGAVRPMFRGEHVSFREGICSLLTCVFFIFLQELHSHQIIYHYSIPGKCHAQPDPNASYTTCDLNPRVKVTRTKLHPRFNAFCRTHSFFLVAKKDIQDVLKWGAGRFIYMSDGLNLGWRILLVSGHRMPKPCKAMGNLKSDTPS